MEFKKITQTDAQKLSELINEMNENLPNPAWFLPMHGNISAVRKMINKSRFYIIGAFKGDDLAGIASLDYKNGKLLEKYPFPSWCDISKLVEFSFSIVALKYRGRGLMFTMLKEIYKIALCQGFEFACCTVHNDNYPSKKNLLKIGFKDYLKIEQETPFPRNLMLMHLKKTN